MERAKKMRGKRWLYGPLILVVTLVLIEWSVRLSLPLMFPVDAQSSWKNWMRFKIGTIPTYEGLPRYVLPTEHNRTHMQDFDGNWFSVHPPKGTLRIIGVGDSHLDYGRGLLESQCFNEKRPYPPKECLVFAAGGYDLADKEALILTRLLEYEPDVIILQLLDDDCHGCPRQTVWDFAPREPGKGGVGVLVALEKLNKFFYRQSSAYRVVWWVGWHAYWRFGNGDEGCPGIVQEEWRVACTKSVARIVDAVRENDIELVTVLSHPVRYDVDEYPRTEQERAFEQWFQGVSEVYGLSPVILREEFSGMDYTQLKADEWGHYNSEGYEVARRALYRELVERGMIPNGIEKE